MYDCAGKSKEELLKDEDIKSYSRSLSHVDENYGEKKEIIQQKSELGKMRKWSCPCVIHCHSISMQKNSEQYYQRVLHLYVPWWNESELVNSKQSYGE